MQTDDVTGATVKAAVAPINRSLEVIVKYVNDEYLIVYHLEYEGVSVHKREDIVIDWKHLPVRTGWRDRQDKLWQWLLIVEVSQWLEQLAPRVPPDNMDQLPPGIVVLAHNMYKLPSSREGVQFMHAVCRYLVKSTWLKAIYNNHYIG